MLRAVARAAVTGFALVVVCSGVVRAEDRTIDGSGNNPLNPTWGQAHTPFMRMAPSAYTDGFSSPGGLGWMNAREISNAVVAQSGAMPNTHDLTSWVFQWGQFVDHDLTLTDLVAPTESMPITIPMGDPMFDPGGTGTAVMPFRRSLYDHATGTGAGNPRQQMNSLTSYLDGSNVYGSDLVRANALRTMSGGRLKTSTGDMLPYNVDHLENADNGDPNRANYYVAGDIRANEQTGLTAVHTLFVREHNRLADLLATDNPGWSDEQIYQHARKIVGAEIQAITYGEFLPALLGEHAPGTTSTYNPTVNPSIANEFATALYRVGHTMLPPELTRVMNDGSPAPGGHLSLRDAFFDPTTMPDGTELEYILKGLASERQQQIDIHVIDDVRNFLFGDPFPGAGFDLPALNIQRGRDHGLADYNTVRMAYGLSPVTSFAEITSDLQLQQALAACYGDVDSIDLWVGALSEDHLPGTTVGELIAAGLIHQFTAVRDGDRFWFMNDEALSLDERAWLSEVRLSDIIRWNTDITNLQDNVFVVPEPAAVVLALAGLGGLLLAARRGRVTRARRRKN